MEYIKLFENHIEYEDFVSGGTMVKPNVSHCIEENHVHYNPRTWADEYLTFVALEDSTFKLSGNSVSYSLDNGETWIELASNTDSPTVTSGNKIMWKGELTPTTSGIGRFNSSGRFDAQGNVMSLLYGDGFKGQTDLTGKDYAFYHLFYNNTNIINVDKMTLPATTLANNCYAGMFGNCTSLTTTPELPATTLASDCYNSMFYGCTSLTTAPELPATTLANYCYDSMFYKCTSLTTAPELPATTLANYCYLNMFYGCTSLTTAPSVLPATTLVSRCYSSMFRGCTSLVNAPVLPATGLAYYSYNMMFSGCRSLNYIKAMFLSTDGNFTPEWVIGVATSGTFVKNPNMTTWETGVDGIPEGWTVQDAS